MNFLNLIFKQIHIVMQIIGPTSFQLFVEWNSLIILLKNLWTITLFRLNHKQPQAISSTVFDFPTKLINLGGLYLNLNIRSKFIIIKIIYELYSLTTLRLIQIRTYIVQHLFRKEFDMNYRSFTKSITIMSLVCKF